jgi:hypothetical protein
VFSRFVVVTERTIVSVCEGVAVKIAVSAAQ